MKAYSYFLINIACLLIPFLASFFAKRAFYKEWKPFFLANILVAILFLIWDYYFTKVGFWGFNPEYISGVNLGNLPIEEVLFFVCIPYACVFTYFILEYLIKNNPIDRFQNYITVGLLMVLIFLGIFSMGKWYTTLTAFLTAGYLLFSLVVRRNLSYHYVTYLLIFPFFLLSNGLLTGSFLESPIVWYNNTENLGIRLWTIPVEDTIYGFLLIALNIDFFNLFRKNKSIGRQEINYTS